MKRQFVFAVVVVLAGCAPGRVEVQPEPVVGPTVAEVRPSGLPAGARREALLVAASGETTAAESPKRPGRSLDFSRAGQAPAGVPAAPYAALFRLDQSWVIRGVQKSSYSDGTVHREQSAFKTSCKVAEVRSFAWGVSSRVECGPLPAIGMEPLLAGTWVATEDGLYFSQESPEARPVEVASLRFILEAIPSPSSKETPSGEESDFGSRRQVSRKGRVWCAETSSWGGDEGWVGLCLAQDTGFVSGQWGWAGGSTHEAEFTARQGR